MNAVAQVVVAVLLILVQVVLEVAEVLHLPVRLVLLVIRVRLEPLLEAVVQDQLIEKHRVVILQQVIVIPVLLPMVLLVLLHVVILQLRQVAVALGVVIRAVVLLLDHHQVEVPLVVAVPEDKY